jgi:cytochrome c55X
MLCVAAASASEVTARRQSELLHLLKHDCGSCHGMRLTGGLGPPLTPEALQKKPKALLEYSIFEGRRGTPMPPWKGMLSEADVRWLVDALKSGALTEQ